MEDTQVIALLLAIIVVLQCINIWVGLKKTTIKFKNETRISGDDIMYLRKRSKEKPIRE